LRLAPLIVTAALTVGGCGKEATGDPGRIDVERGTFRGVGIGDTFARMQAVFGGRGRATYDERIDPEGAPEYFEGPDYIPAAKPGFRYESVSFLTDNEGLITYVMVTAPRSTTERGVAVGDDLDEARGTYPEVRCGTVNEGSDYTEYPACTGRVAVRRHVWFGGDPISNITIGVGALGGI
jgi:hypothetical protein